MRVYWRDGSLTLEPESREEKNALKVVSRSLKFAPASWKVAAFGSCESISDGHDEEVVLSADRRTEEVE